MAEFTDDRSDSEAWQGASSDIEGFMKWLPAGEAPLFTANTPTPRKSGSNWLSKLDEQLSRSLQDHVGHAYRDMRAQWWQVKWNGQAWTAYPTKATAEKYNAEFGTKMDPKRMYAAASDAHGLITAVDERIEAARVEAKSQGGWGWILLVIGGALLLGKKKGRR
jgi:hypothetical protein